VNFVVVLDVFVLVLLVLVVQVFFFHFLSLHDGCARLPSACASPPAVSAYEAVP
jgi:hypothetical protein